MMTWVSAVSATPVITLVPNLASPQPVGTVVTFRAAVTGGSSGSQYDYRFAVGLQGEPPQVRRAFAPKQAFTWAQNEFEGTFLIRVVVRDRSTKPFTIYPPVTVAYTIEPRVPLNGPAAVFPTAHPLVALFSAPACAAGNTRRVVFYRPGGSPMMTNAAACTGKTTQNFLVAGMLPNTLYEMRSQVLDASRTVIHTGNTFTYTTGSIDPSQFPPFTAVSPASPAAEAYPVVFHALLNIGALFGKPAYFPTATDLSGNVIWYYPVPSSVGRIEHNGNLWVSLTNGNASQAVGQIGREVDLAGNTVREFNVRTASEELLAMGGPKITDWHHEIRRILPSNDILVLASRDISVTNANQCGSTGGVPKTCDVIGDLIVVLNENLAVKWFWDPFTKLTPDNLVNINRPALLGETCAPNGPGCSPITAIDPSTAVVYTTANDWMHANAAQYTPDGNIILSVRHQDVVLKINYQNGHGDGRVLWTLGNGGDFSFTTPTTACTGTGYNGLYQWFTHQHDPEFQTDGSFTVFDNGNTRKFYCDPEGNSRGQAYTINEENRTVTPLLDADLGSYSFALGSAQPVKYQAAPHYSFNSGVIGGFGPQGYSQTTEVDPSGNIVFNLQAPTLTYRTFRMTDLYSPPEP